MAAAGRRWRCSSRPPAHARRRGTRGRGSRRRRRRRRPGCTGPPRRRRTGSARAAGPGRRVTPFSRAIAMIRRATWSAPFATTCGAGSGRGVAQGDRVVGRVGDDDVGVGDRGHHAADGHLALAALELALDLGVDVLLLGLAPDLVLGHAEVALVLPALVDEVGDGDHDVDGHDREADLHDDRAAHDRDRLARARAGQADQVGDRRPSGPRRRRRPVSVTLMRSLTSAHQRSAVENRRLTPDDRVEHREARLQDLGVMPGLTWIAEATTPTTTPATANGAVRRRSSQPASIMTCQPSDDRDRAAVAGARQRRGHDGANPVEQPAAREGEHREGGEHAEAGVDLPAAGDLAPLARPRRASRCRPLGPIACRAGHATPPSPCAPSVTPQPALILSAAVGSARADHPLLRQEGGEG